MPKVLVIGERPFHLDRGGPFTSASGHWYRKFADEYGLNASFVYLTDKTSGKLFYRQGKEFVPTHELTSAARSFQVKIDAINPDLIITCGKAALSAVTGEMDLAKNHCYILKDAKGRPVIPTFRPQDMMLVQSRVFWIKKAFQKAGDIIDGAIPASYELVFDNDGVKAEASLKRVLENAKECSIDIETTKDDCATLTAIGWSEGNTGYAITPDCVQWGSCLKLYYEIMENPRITKIGQNFMYDSQALWKRDGVKVRGLVWDTLHAANVLYCDLEKSLGDLGRLYLYETPWKGHWSSRGEALRIYNAQDVIFTKLIREAQEKHLKVRGVYEYFNALHPKLFVPSFSMAVRGIHVNEDTRKAQLDLAQEALEEPLRTVAEFGNQYVGPKETKKRKRDNEKDTLATFRGLSLPEGKVSRKELNNLLRPFLQGEKPSEYYIAKPADQKKYGLQAGMLYKKAYYHEIIMENRQFNPGSSAQVKAVLTNAGVKLPRTKVGKEWKESSNNDSLLKILSRNKDSEDVLQFVRNLQIIREGNKLITSYLNADICPDSRWRCFYNMEGTKSGRSSTKKTPWSTGGNNQNMPRDGFRGIKFKKVFEADPGFTLVQCDLSAAEARVVAWLGEDDYTLEAMDKGEDLHLHTVALIYDEDYHSLVKSDPRRQKVKPVRHGGNYNMGAGTLASTMLRAGVEVSVDEAQELLDRFHAAAPSVRKVFHASIDEQVNRTRRLKTPFGRIREFTGKITNNVLRDAYSFIPQSTVPHIINLLWLWTEAQEETLAGDVQVLQMGHDALLYQVRDDLLDNFIPRYLAQAEQIRFDVGKYKNVYIPSDAEVGKNWGDMVEYKPKS